MRRLILLVALSVLASPAHAGFYSGKDLLAACAVDKSSSAYFEKNYECVAYVAGAVDAFNTTRAANGLKSCIPPKVTIRQLRNVTVDYLDATPKALVNAASAGVFSATRQAWPCKPQKAPPQKAKSKRKG